ncbi:hypothetical protein LINGRAHAP2_LOCUS9593 [Linum grandiflorum]
MLAILPHPCTSGQFAPPSNHYVGIHCNGSFLPNSHMSTYGVIRYNAHGVVFDGKVTRFLCSSLFTIKVKAVLVVIEVASSISTQSLFSLIVRHSRSVAQL